MPIHAPNYTQIPNIILDALPLLSNAEFKVVSFICRHTFGFHKEKAKMSLSFIMRGTGLSRQGVINATESLVSRDWIEKTPFGDSFEYSVKIDSLEEVVNSVDQSTQLTRGSQLSVPPQSTQLTSTSQLSVPGVVNSVDSNKEKEKKKEREEACDSGCDSKESPPPPVLPNKPHGYMHPAERMEARLKGGGLGRFWPQLIGEGLNEVWIGPGRNDFDANLITAAIAHLKKYELPHERGDALQYIRNCITKAKFADLEARLEEAKAKKPARSQDGTLSPYDESEIGKNWHEKQKWAADFQKFVEGAKAIGVGVEPWKSFNPIYWYRLPGWEKQKRGEFAAKFMHLTLESWHNQIQGAA